jgi:hypothetical protein
MRKTKRTDPAWPRRSDHRSRLRRPIVLEVSSFVPADFDVPQTLDGPGFRLEPLDTGHNARDYAAWSSSIDHIRATPGFPDPDDDWPYPMSLEENMSDMEMHARHFAERRGFTWTVLEGDDVIGCVYLYPTKAEGYDAEVSSWVTEPRAHLDEVLWREVNAWIAAEWPFESVLDHPRTSA